MEDAIRTRDAKSLVQSMISHISAAEIGTTLALDNNINRLKSLKDLLNLSVTEIERSIAQIANEEARKVGTVGEAYIIIEDAQLIEPRGRFTVSMSLDGILLEGKQVTTFVPWPKISHCACLPSTVSTKREGEELMAILLGEPVKYNNKDITTLLWNLSKSVTKPLTANLPSAAISGTEHYIVSTLLSTLGNQRIVLPDKVLFQSVASKKPFLKCYRGIQEGSLYPLKNGMIFLKPILFIPTEKIASLTAGRGGGSGTRYIDLMIETIDGVKHEFTNIEREELLAIQIYVTEFLEVRRRAEAARTCIKDEEGLKIELKADENGELEEDDDDDESGDEDFDPDALDEDASGRDSDDSRCSDGEGDGSGADSDAENEPVRRAEKIVEKVNARSPVQKRKAAAIAASKITEEVNDKLPVRKYKSETESVAEAADIPESKKIKVEGFEDIFVKDEA